jgi:tetratricopeptide (TPR) repeat protein
MDLLFQSHGRLRRPFMLMLSALLVLLFVLGGRMLQGVAGEDGAAAYAPGIGQLSTEESVMQLRERLLHNPGDTATYTRLGLALLQLVRETADAALYVQAEEAFQEALRRNPDQVDAVVGQGMLALARHEFAHALELGQQAQQMNPYKAESLGILVDAQVELGRYDEAVMSAQAMVNLRPDLASYTRVSYLRELHGETAGAIAAMQAALGTAVPGSEAALWTQVQLGNLYFHSGDMSGAEENYRQALAFRPDYPYARAGLARVQAAQGDIQAAIGSFQELVARLPLPEFVIALGELYETTGRPAEAEQQYELVRAIQQLQAGAGVNSDLELALFDVDRIAQPFHGQSGERERDVAAALEAARAAYSRRPTVYAADTLAWALYQNGDAAAARRFSREALRLGTRDALLHYHAGLIAWALGDAPAAHGHLSRALALNPAFSIRYAPHARQVLAVLETELTHQSVERNR